MMTTTVRIVHSTMEAMPTARLMKEKLRASREAISAVTMSPLAIAVRTYVMWEGGRWVCGREEKLEYMLCNKKKHEWVKNKQGVDFTAAQAGRVEKRPLHTASTRHSSA